MEFLPQGSGDFLFCIKYHSRYSNTFPAYIDCCVLIPVHSISARTLINAITQLQILFYVSTTAAGFGTGIPAVNTDQFLPGAFHFICQKIREHSPAIVMNTLFQNTYPGSFLSCSKILCTQDHKNWLSFWIPCADNLSADVQYEHGVWLFSFSASCNGCSPFRNDSACAAPLQVFPGIFGKVGIICMSSMGIYIQFAHGKIKSDCGFYWPDFMFRFFCRIQYWYIILVICFLADGGTLQYITIIDTPMLFLCGSNPLSEVSLYHSAK